MSESKGTPTAIAAVTSLIAAATCCIPLGTVVAAAGTAGASAMLDTARWWLMPLSGVLIAVALWQTYRHRPLSGKRPLAGQIILWTAAAMVAMMFVFPQQVALLVANRPASQGGSAPAPVTPFALQDFKAQFNAASKQLRVVVLLSPS